MDHRNDAALQFLATRRSHPPKMMTGPGPDPDQLADLLTLAARVPDHGKLEPWRFVVLGRQTLEAMAPLLRDAVLAAGQDQTAADKAVQSALKESEPEEGEIADGPSGEAGALCGRGKAGGAVD